MLVRDIEHALNLSEQNGYGFTAMALKRGALIQLCRRLQPRAEPYRILELGGGQSTLFWHAVAKLGLLHLEVLTLEHEEKFIQELSDKIIRKNNSKYAVEIDNPAIDSSIAAPSIRLFPQRLRQISDTESNSLFEKPTHALEAWGGFGQLLGPEFDRNYTIRNAFYSDLQKLELQPDSVDVLVNDGPHGNGRSLAYPLFAPYLSKEAYLLIDDADHYPFQEDAQRVFKLNTLYKEHWGVKKWVLLQRSDAN